MNTPVGPFAAAAHYSLDSTELIVRFKPNRAVREGLRMMAGATPHSDSPRSLTVLTRAESFEALFPAKEVRTTSGGHRLAVSFREAAEQEPDATAGLNVARYKTPAEALAAVAALVADDRIEYAHVIPPRYPLVTEKRPKKAAARKLKRNAAVDPMRNRQWGLTAVQLAQAQALAGFREADGVKIAVIDSGYDNTHPDLKGVVADELDFTGTKVQDIQGHGTHVIGIIAALRDNALGISGLCQSRQILSLKALGPYNGPGYYRALRYAVTAGAKVINLSLGGGEDPTERLLIAQAIAAGVNVVAAMGNDAQRGNPTSYPANLPDVIAVGATDELDRRADFSQHGKHIALAAPGVNILSTVPTYPSSLASTTLYEAWPGTSMAAPFVSATVALLYAKKPAASVVEIKAALKAGTDLVAGEVGFSNHYGHGRLNVRKALQAL